MQEEHYFKLYKVFTGKAARIVRVLVFLLLILASLLFFDEYDFLVRLLPLYFFFILQELFIRQKLGRMKSVGIVEKAQDLHSALAFEAKNLLLSEHSAFEIASLILKTTEGRYLLGKINASEKLVNVEIHKDDLLNQAGDLVRAMHGKHIYPIDFLASYILLQEANAKFFERSSLAKQDMVGILYWTRKRFHIEEIRPQLFRFSGLGIFDSLISGWTPETRRYTTDFTREVLGLGYEPKAVGREKEYRQFVEGLSKSESSNVLLVGDPGVGKTTLVMDFAYDAHQGLLHKSWRRKRVYFLFVDRLLSGTVTKGALEERLAMIFMEISHSNNIILFIEDMENILGGGGFDFDMGGALMPYLTSNKVQIIGTATPQAYKEYIETKPSIQSLFNIVNIEEPDSHNALFMLIEEANIREILTKSSIDYASIKEVVSSSKFYLPEISLPGSGARLLEDSMIRAFNSGRTSIVAEDVRGLVSDKTGIKLSRPTSEEKDTLLNLEDELHEKIIGQNEPVSAVSNAIRRVRSGIRKTEGPIATFLFLGPTGVGKTTTAELLSEIYFSKKSKLIRADMSEYQTQDSLRKLLGGLPGEDNFEESFVDKVKSNPFSVVLLDEFEKAHPRLLDIFLQIFDEGFVTDNKGEKVSFSNCIIIATSNAGSEFIREKIVYGNEDIKDDLIEHVLTKGIFKPELVNRFDDVIVFHPLSQEQIVEIVKLRVRELNKKMESQYINLEFRSDALDKIAEESFDPDFGARNVARFIKDSIENPLSRLILEEKIQKGDTAEIGVSESGYLSINKI